MGEKIGTFIQYMSTGIFGFVLGFTKSWKLSLVMLAVTPLVIKFLYILVNSCLRKNNIEPIFHKNSS